MSYQPETERLRRWLSVILIAFAIPGCAADESPAPKTGNAPVTASQPEPSRAAYPLRAPEEQLGCGGPGYTVTYTGSTRATVPMIMVTFRGQRPTSALADRALRTCIQLVSDTKLLTEGILANAWWRAAGTEDDDELVELPDGSRHLMTRLGPPMVIETDRERAGEAARVTDGPDGTYFLEYIEQHTASGVTPRRTFAHLSVIFKSKPTEKQAYNALVVELRKAAVAAPTIEITAFAYVGPRDDPAGRSQVSGSFGYIDLNYKPGDPQLRDDDVAIAPLAAVR